MLLAADTDRNAVTCLVGLIRERGAGSQVKSFGFADYNGGRTWTVDEG